MRIQLGIVAPAFAEEHAPDYARATVRGLMAIGETAKRELNRPALTPNMGYTIKPTGHVGMQLFPGQGLWPFTEAGARPHSIWVDKEKSSALHWGGNAYAHWTFHPGLPARPWLAPGFEAGTTGPWVSLLVDSIAEEFPK